MQTLPNAVRPTLVLAAMATAAVAGCASYRVGNNTLYAPDVQTVYVPIVVSDSFRRDLGERLTEAIIKEIEEKTPYKVVGSPEADSILSTRLVGDLKNVTIENENDDPRAIELLLTAEVTWLNRRRIPIQPPQAIPLPPGLVDVGQTGTLIPAVGQSLVASQQQAIERLAEQIVATMEQPW